MSNEDQFESQVRECCSALTDHLPAVAQRHSPLALLAALAEHVGGALRLFQQSGTCTPEEARAVLDRCAYIAFKAPLDP